MLLGSDDCTFVGSADGILLCSVLGSATEPDAEPVPSSVGVLVCTKSKVGSAVGALVGSEVGCEVGCDVGSVVGCDVASVVGSVVDVSVGSDDGMLLNVADG